MNVFDIELKLPNKDNRLVFMK